MLPLSFFIYTTSKLFFLRRKKSCFSLFFWARATHASLTSNFFGYHLRFAVDPYFPPLLMHRDLKHRVSLVYWPDNLTLNTSWHWQKEPQSSTKNVKANKSLFFVKTKTTRNMTVFAWFSFERNQIENHCMLLKLIYENWKIKPQTGLLPLKSRKIPLKICEIIHGY